MQPSSDMSTEVHPSLPKFTRIHQRAPKPTRTTQLLHIIPFQPKTLQTLPGFYPESTQSPPRVQPESNQSPTRVHLIETWVHQRSPKSTEVWTGVPKSLRVYLKYSLDSQSQPKASQVHPCPQESTCYQTWIWWQIWTWAAKSFKKLVSVLMLSF